MNKITTLNDSYMDNNIESVNVLLVESMTGTELEYDVLDARVDPTVEIPTIIKPVDYDGIMTTDQQILGCKPYFTVLASNPTQYRYGRAVLYYHDNILIGKFYMQRCLRVKKNLYSISCVSGIGLLEKSKHYGGLYVTGNDTFASVVADVIGGLVPYTIDETIASQRVLGWLPIATRRENLHQLLFAMGATIKKDENGDMFITVLSLTTTKSIPDSRIYVGGSVEYPEDVTKVSVLEHAYLDKGAADEQTTLFEGYVNQSRNPFVSPKGNVLTGMLVEFSEPMHDLAITAGAGEILESGVNYAILSGAENVELTGYKYTHTTVERFVGDVTADEDNTVTIADATLITRANSGNVVDRLYSYYTKAKTIKMDIVADGERAGDAVSFNDPFDDKQSGLISELYLVGSNILKGSAKVIADYAPTWGNDYTDVIIVTSSQSVTLPDYANKCRAVLIGGGTGGDRGGTGGTGEKADDGYGKGGAGGDGGAAGAGGRIIEPIIGQDCGGMTFDCVIGTGGKGGTKDNPTGSAGTDTTMTYTKNGKTVNLTTAIGTPSVSGFQDFLEPVNVYGTYGADGIAGAKGGGSDGKAGNIAYDGTTYKGGEKVADRTEECEDGFYLLYKKPFIYEKFQQDDENLSKIYNPEIFISIFVHGISYDTLVDENGNGLPAHTGYTITVDKGFGIYQGRLLFYRYGTFEGSFELYDKLMPNSFTITHSDSYATMLQLDVREERQDDPNTVPTTLLCDVVMADFAYMSKTAHYGYGSGAVVADNGNVSTDMTGASGVAATVAGADATIRGSGGSGGNGGSGGGAGGWLDYSNEKVEPIYYDSGVGGEGSDGGDGADGIILIYYAKDVVE